MHCNTPSTKVSSVSPHDQPFSRYCTFYDFPSNSHVKILRCHKIFIFLADHQISYNFIFPYGCRIDNKVWLRSDQNCRGSVLKFPAPYGPVLKNVKCHKSFNFWQIAKTFITFYSPMTNLYIIKFGSDQMKIVGGVAFWNFCSHMVKMWKMRILKKKKKMVWRFGG